MTTQSPALLKLMSILQFTSILLVCMLAASLAPIVVQADFQKKEWKFLKPVSSFTPADGRYIRLPLNAEIYDHAQSSLADLRLVDDQEKETPYALYEHLAKTVEETYSPKFYNLSLRPNAYSTFTLDFGKDVLNNKMHIKTGSKDFKRRVEISGSLDGRNWLLIKRDAYIFDFRGDENVQFTTIHYPENRYRFLQVKVWNGHDHPLELQGATVHLARLTKPKRVPRAFQLISRQEDGKTKTSVCLFDMKYQNIPFDFLQMDTAEENFSRLVEIWVSQDGKEWNRQLQSEFYRFRVDHASSEKKTFIFPEVRKRYMKVIIFNQDDSSLQLASFDIQGVEKDILFQPRFGRQYQLYYGNSRAIAAQYDLARFSGYMNVSDLQEGDLGKETVNPDYAPLPLWKPWTERYPVVFWSLLVFMVVGLGAYVVRLMLSTK
jgi:hypothetical protein